MRTKNNNLMIAIAVFIICLIVHTAEVFFIRTDESIFAECFINKVDCDTCYNRFIQKNLNSMIYQET